MATRHLKIVPLAYSVSDWVRHTFYTCKVQLIAWDTLFTPFGHKGLCKNVQKYV